MRALIVTPARARGVLMAVRALRSAGWEVGVGTPSGTGLAAVSRHVARRHVVSRPRGDLEGFVSGVQQAIGEGAYDVVFGGGDDWIAALVEHRSEFDARVGHPDVAAVRRGLDKLALARAAEATGLASPRTVPADPDALDSWSGPVIVKCRSHWQPGVDHPYRIEAERFDRVDAEAQAHVSRLRDIGYEPLLQEPVAGHLAALSGLFDGSELHGAVQQRAHRLWPTPLGVSSRAVTVRVDPELRARAAALLREIGWSGLVELQFIESDGPPRLIDLNGRFFGSIGLALSAGGNLADAWARHELGLPVPDLPDGRPGVRYVWLAGDLRRASAERRGGLLRDLVSTATWAASRDLARVWDPLDPAPVLHLVTSRLRRRPAAVDGP